MEQKKYPITNPQKNIYLIENFYKGTPVNNVCGTCIFHSVLNFELLKQALYMLIQNNDSFKMHLDIKHGEVFQYLDNSISYNIEIADITDMSEVDNIENEFQKKVYNVFSNENTFDIKIFRFPNNQGGYVIQIHHLFSDSWTLGLVAHKVAEYYNLLLNGQHELDSEKKFSYIDYIDDEITYKNSDKFKKDEDYWNSVFNTIPESATIYSKKNNSSSRTDCTAHRSKFNLDKTKLELINNFCKENNISIFNFLMSVYSIYLSKITGLQDFNIGTPILNRSNFAQKQTLGVFIGTLPLRFNIDLTDSFIDYSKKVAVNSLSLLRHSKYPYQTLLENLRAKQPDLPNLYNILLSYQITKTNTDGYDYETRWAFNGNCPDDMQIHILDLNDYGSMDIYYDFKTAKYDETDIENMHNRILYIIDQVLKNGSTKLADISAITRSERLKITNKYNKTDITYDTSKTIVDLFEEKVASNPLDNAIVCNGKKLTYSELNKKANQLARHLTKNNIGKNDLVCIMTSRSIEMVVGLLAILKIGGCYIPVDPNYPAERVNYLIENSSSKAILVDDVTCNSCNSDFTITSVNDSSAEVQPRTAFEDSLKINISLNNEFYNTEDTDNLNTEISSDSLMYLIYTSGSTGKPKGVMLTHKNVHNFLVGINNVIDFKYNKTILSVTTICFDIFGLELWGGLTNGLTVVIATEDEQNNAELLNKLCIENHVEIMQTTPSRMSYFLNNDSNLEFLNYLNAILLGGESLPEKIVEDIQDKCTAKIFNMYGPTETTIWSTIKEIKDSKDISIGTPIANTKCFILDNKQNLLPPYTPGLLYIGGDGVSKGYYHLPEMTLERFIKSPFGSTKNKEFIYNTGDLAYYDENGNIYHLGRNDFQIKLRGYRIELGEIENKILTFEGIKETAVIANNNSLICFYTTNDSGKIKESSLISYLLEALPEYMVPAEFIKLEEMPLTPNGKLDRKALPKITTSVIEEELPSTNTEKLLATMISKIIKKEVTNINETFIGMGLDSLGIIQVQTELLSSNINITTHYFYKYPTIKKLAKKIDVKTNNYTEQNSQIPEQFKHHPDEILNSISSIDVNENVLGNVLLTGATGFIGIHILHELLHTTTNNIYCLIRGENYEARLRKLLTNFKFYFSEDITSYINERIFIIGGDISYINLKLEYDDYEFLKKNINTIINGAAIVKHYGQFEDFEKNNIEGTKNIIDFAYQHGIRLMHLSSISVSGNYLVKQDNRDVDFSENDLYIGQHYQDNNYVYSKMESEKLILQYMSKGLKAKILRIGIASGRFSDGFFQKGIEENAFYGRIKSIIKMHAVSDSMTLQNIEFTPVDLCAKAIVTLAKNSIGDNRIFHIYNHNLVTIFKLLEALKKMDINVNILNSSEFNDYILNLTKTEKSALKGIINDLVYDENNLLTINYNFTVNIHSNYTKNYLHLLNFDWPVIDEEYLLKILKYMKDVNFI